MSKFRLNPGIPFKGDMFGGNAPKGSIRNNTNSNTHIPPHPPVLCSKVLADGKEDSWLEYVPADLDPESRPPLIISCHGGGAQAQMQFDETSWCYIAEQEGAVAVFPNAGGTRRSWLTADDAEQKPGERPSMLDVFTENPDGRASETAHHIQFLKALIQEMKAKYNIDEGRVYVQGMSMGDIMTMMFARVCGDLLAGIDSTAGPSPQVALFDDDGNIKGFKCPVPVYQSRGELDAIVVGPVAGKENTTRQDVNYINRKFWLKVNECDTLPRLSILDVNNFAFYTGKKANVVYRDVKHRAHGQTLDDAYWAWHTLFKGTRRNPDGSITCLDTDYSSRGDVDAAALCDGCSYAYINNTRVKLEAPAFIEPLSNFDFATRSLQEYKQNGVLMGRKKAVGHHHGHGIDPRGAVLKGHAQIGENIQQLRSEAHFPVHHAFFHQNGVEAFPPGHAGDRRGTDPLRQSRYDQRSRILRAVGIADIDGDIRLPHREYRVFMQDRSPHIAQFPKLLIGDIGDGLRFLHDPGIREQDAGHVRPVLIEIRRGSPGHQGA